MKKQTTLFVCPSMIVVALTLYGCGDHGGRQHPTVCPVPPQPSVGKDSAVSPVVVPTNSEISDFTPLAWAEAEAKADSMLTRMTPCEKYYLMMGIGWENRSVPKWGYYVGGTPSLPHLGIPSLNMHDASGGFRTIRKEFIGTVTAWPSMLAWAATWDVELVKTLAMSLGAEFRGKGANGILGPSLNVHRVARGGRNFELLGGEDPYLASRLVSAYIAGVHSQGVFTVMKHWVLNHQETNRESQSSDAGDKVKWEIYYQPFKSAIRAGVTAAMCSYNKENTTYSCSNAHELAVLKKTLHFRGFVQSDWWASHGTTVAAGLDQEMPGSIKDSMYLSPDNLNSVELTDVDASVRRILSVMYRMDLFGRTRCTPPNCAEHMLTNVTSATHIALARKAAAESIVFLKSDWSLPLSGKKRIAVIGQAAVASAYDPTAEGAAWNTGDYYSGGGSGHVVARHVVTPFQGISERCIKENIECLFAEKGREARNLAVWADVVIVVAATTSGEGQDRKNLSLDHGADGLIETVAKIAQQKTIVLVQTPGAVLMPWAKSVSNIFAMFLGGQETGHAWADVLFGDIAPSGRLPIMMPVSENDTIVPQTGVSAEYTEGMETSYRSSRFKSAFVFGHGLTYTTFDFETPVEQLCSCIIEAICISIVVKNMGTIAARTVPQLYLEFPKVANYPKPLLKGFKKTEVIPPGNTSTVVFILTDEDMSYYSEIRERWELASASDLTAHIGESSQDIRQVMKLSSARSSRVISDDCDKSTPAFGKVPTVEHYLHV
eukprot:TRINITY_DN18575_c3_g1_i1.p1 TRINITY_DN18575_c3_g1~~TRINITY_DN18575_c3_g1_i1.p1  ORF type:complete len:774 (-),score=78.77 TRINITY_DN18575_c3_g1_i1:236-2557(-)